MAKSEGQKMKLFVLKDILERETDATHGITMARILELLSMRGIKAERKSIYDDLRAFREQDILDVTVPQGQNREYAVASRTFEISELKMMIDAIQSSKFLSEAKTRDLIKKLEGMCSKHEAKELNRQVIIANRVKSISSSTALFRNVDAIHRAIQENRQISFPYLEWTLKKELSPREGKERYLVSPWALIWREENYYLVAYDSASSMMKHYRVDKMGAVEILEMKREGAMQAKEMDLAAYANRTFGMYGGKEEVVTLRFPNRLIGVVLDRFGKDADILPAEEGFFKCRTKIAVSGQFFGWMTGIGKEASIVSPKDVREQYREWLQEILNVEPC